MSNREDDKRARVYTTPDLGSPPERDGFVRRVLIVLGLVVATLLLLVLAWVAVEVLLVVFAGVLLAVLLRSLANLIGRYTPLSSGWALLVVIVGLLALFGVGGSLLAPRVAEESAQLAQVIPEGLEQVESWMEGFPLGRQFLEQRPGVEELLGSGVGTMLAQVGGIFSTTLGVLVETVVVLFLGVYLAINPQKYIDGIVRLVPIAKRPRAREVIGTLGFTLEWFLLGRLMAMIAVGIVTTIGLWLLDVPLALVFGVITTLLTFVPYVGPIVAAILPALVALTVDPMLAVYVLLLYLVVQNLEGYLLTPLILQGTVSVPPALTIIAEVLGGILFGVLGIILATPFIAIAVVLVKTLYIEDVLGDQIQVIGDGEQKDDQEAAAQEQRAARSRCDTPPEGAQPR